MNKPDLKVVPIYESNFRDAAKTLRVIADQIDAGQHGTVHNLAIVLHNDDMVVFGAGPDESLAETALLLWRGFKRIAGD